MGTIIKPRSADDQLPDEPDTYDHAGIKVLAKALGRTMQSLTVLQRDPFTADGDGGNRTGNGGRIAGAQWYAEEVHEHLDIPPEAHMRRCYRFDTAYRRRRIPVPFPVSSRQCRACSVGSQLRTLIRCHRFEVALRMVREDNPASRNKKRQWL
jgi:hypothetical protein